MALEDPNLGFRTGIVELGLFNLCWDLHWTPPRSAKPQAAQVLWDHLIVAWQQPQLLLPAALAVLRPCAGQGLGKNVHDHQKGVNLLF